jgi:hypothetical protein
MSKSKKSRLIRTLKLLQDYDTLASMALFEDIDKVSGGEWLESLREEKDHLIVELREHGCRRER